MLWMTCSHTYRPEIATRHRPKTRPLAPGAHELGQNHCPLRTDPFHHGARPKPSSLSRCFPSGLFRALAPRLRLLEVSRGHASALHFHQLLQGGEDERGGISLN